jgi:hypothetical protein
MSDVVEVGGVVVGIRVGGQVYAVQGQWEVGDFVDTATATRRRARRLVSAAFCYRGGHRPQGGFFGLAGHSAGMVGAAAVVAEKIVRASWIYIAKLPNGGWWIVAARDHAIYPRGPSVPQGGDVVIMDAGEAASYVSALIETVQPLAIEGDDSLHDNDSVVAEAHRWLVCETARGLAEVLVLDAPTLCETATLSRNLVRGVLLGGALAVGGVLGTIGVSRLHTDDADTRPVAPSLPIAPKPVKPQVVEVEEAALVPQVPVPAPARTLTPPQAAGWLDDCLRDIQKVVRGGAVGVGGTVLCGSDGLRLGNDKGVRVSETAFGLGRALVAATDQAPEALLTRLGTSLGRLGVRSGGGDDVRSRVGAVEKTLASAGLEGSRRVAFRFDTGLAPGVWSRALGDPAIQIETVTLTLGGGVGWRVQGWIHGKK